MLKYFLEKFRFRTKFFNEVSAEEQSLGKNKAKMAKSKYLAEEFILSYNESSLLKLFTASTSPIGLAINTILTTKGQSISQKRQLSFYEELKSQIDEIDERLISLEFLDSEEFFDLLIKILEISSKTRHDEKREMLAKILVQRSVKNKHAVNPEFFINVIEELTIEELLVARKLYRLKISEEYNVIAEKLKKDGSSALTKHVLSTCDMGIHSEDFEFILLRLEKSGLIKEVSGMIFDYSGGDYELTETFKKMMKFLTKNHD